MVQVKKHFFIPVLALGLVILFISAKPNEIIDYDRIIPIESDTFCYIHPKITKAYKTYIFPENNFVSIVKLINQDSAILFYTLNKSKSPKAFILKYPIDLRKGKPLFFSEYSSNNSLAWMVYRSTACDTNEVVVARLNSYNTESVFVKTENLSIFENNFINGKIELGHASPFGGYCVSHILREDESHNYSSEGIWFDKMIASKQNLILKRKL